MQIKKYGTLLKFCSTSKNYNDIFLFNYLKCFLILNTKLKIFSLTFHRISTKYFIFFLHYTTDLLNNQITKYSLCNNYVFRGIKWD